MRQFILASGFTPLGDDVTLESVGVGVLTLANVTDKIANLVLRRAEAEGGDVAFPIYPKELTYVKASYAAGAKFAANFTIPEINPYLDYTVTFVKKGKQFNDRSNWSACVRSSASDTAETIANKIAKFVTDNPTLGLTATVEGAKISVEAKVTGEDYAIIMGDELYGTSIEVTASGKPAFMDAAMIKDLFAKAAADAGYEYTYDNFDIYPGYEFNPLKQADAIDTGFDVYTLRFTEPRVMGTHEEDVYQIIQVAFPTGKGGALTAALDEFIGKPAATEGDEVTES